MPSQLHQDAEHMPPSSHSGVQIRNVEYDDLPRIYEMQLLALTFPRSAADFATHWEELLRNPSVAAKVIMLGDVMVGCVSCFQQDGLESVGYWIDKDHRGKGIATRALELLLHEVTKRPLHARAATSNAASLRVLQKCGFEVVRIQITPADGRYPECEDAVLVLRPGPLQIRRYLPGEEGAIWAVYFGSTRNVVAKEYTLDQIQRWAPESPDWESWAGELARTNPFVAVIDGQLVGFAELESDGHINRFYCHHEFQRQGIGAALFRALEQEAIRLGLPALFAEVSTTGIRFFVAQGFEIEEERCNIVCHAPARQFIVRKRLI